MRGQGRETGPHQLGDPLVRAQAREPGQVGSGEHLAVGPVLEMDQKIVAAAREQTPGKADVHAQVGGAGA